MRETTREEDIPCVHSSICGMLVRRDHRIAEIVSVNTFLKYRWQSMHFSPGYL